jgi:hypothetical protein
MRYRIYTCRICHGHIGDDDPVIRYGIRHYVHPTCYLNDDRPLTALSPGQLRQLPYFLLEQKGLLDEVKRLLGLQS